MSSQTVTGGSSKRALVIILAVVAVVAIILGILWLGGWAPSFLNSGSHVKKAVTTCTAAWLRWSWASRPASARGGPTRSNQGVTGRTRDRGRPAVPPSTPGSPQYPRTD